MLDNTVQLMSYLSVFMDKMIMCNLFLVFETKVKKPVIQLANSWSTVFISHPVHLNLTPIAYNSNLPFKQLDMVKNMFFCDEIFHDIFNVFLCIF